MTELILVKGEKLPWLPISCRNAAHKRRLSPQNMLYRKNAIILKGSCLITYLHRKMLPMTHYMYLLFSLLARLLTKLFFSFSQAQICLLLLARGSHLAISVTRPAKPVKVLLGLIWTQHSWLKLAYTGGCILSSLNQFWYRVFKNFIMNFIGCGFEDILYTSWIIHFEKIFVGMN